MSFWYTIKKFTAFSDSRASTWFSQGTRRCLEVCHSDAPRRCWILIFEGRSDAGKLNPGLSRSNASPGRRRTGTHKLQIEFSSSKWSRGGVEESVVGAATQVRVHGYYDNDGTVALVSRSIYKPHWLTLRTRPQKKIQIYGAKRFRLFARLEPASAKSVLNTTPGSWFPFANWEEGRVEKVKNCDRY